MGTVTSEGSVPFGFTTDVLRTELRQGGLVPVAHMGVEVHVTADGETFKFKDLIRTDPANGSAVLTKMYPEGANGILPSIINSVHASAEEAEDRVREVQVDNVVRSRARAYLIGTIFGGLTGASLVATTGLALRENMEEYGFRVGLASVGSSVLLLITTILGQKDKQAAVATLGQDEVAKATKRRTVTEMMLKSITKDNA